MVVCKFFREGTCRYGDNCRFEHSYNSRYSYYPSPAAAPPQHTHAHTASPDLADYIAQVTKDTRAALNGKQWVLSCFAPFSKKNFPGFFDVSPEEVRLAIYEANESNTVDQAKASYDKLAQEAISKYERIQDPDTTIIKTLQSVYKQENAQNPFGGSPGTFGSHSSAHSIFGGQSKPISPHSVFGGQSGSPTPQSVFGGQSSSPTPQSVFGGQNTSALGVFSKQSNSQSVFGGQNNTPTPQSVFGGINIASSPQSVFSGQNSSPSPRSVFGSPSTLDGQYKSDSAFSATSNQNIFGGQTSASNVFSGQAKPENVFGQTANQPSLAQSVFAQANQNVFGSTQPGQSVFGSPRPFGQSDQNVFSKSSENVFEPSPQSPFGTVTQTAQNQSAGHGQQSSGDSVTYSKVDDLSPEDLEQYAADSFEFGFIPELPPPQVLCF